MPVLITAMNAARKEALIPILNGIGTNTLDEYRFAEALSDIQTYYFAGTFIGGLQAIQKDAGAKEIEAELNIERIRLTKFGKIGDSGERIKDWARASAENKAALNEWRDTNLPGVPIPQFFRLDEFDAKRTEMIDNLNIP